MKTVYACYVVDGTSMSVIPKLVGVALTREDADGWKAARPTGSWASRFYGEVRVLTPESKTEHN